MHITGPLICHVSTCTRPGCSEIAGCQGHAGREQSTPTVNHGKGHGCACVDRDSVQCAAIRYGMDHWGEPCECPCHQWDDDEDFLAGKTSCDLSGDGTCEACQ